MDKPVSDHYVSEGMLLRCAHRLVLTRCTLPEECIHHGDITVRKHGDLFVSHIQEHLHLFIVFEWDIIFAVHIRLDAYNSCWITCQKCAKIGVSFGAITQVTTWNQIAESVLA